MRCVRHFDDGRVPGRKDTQAHQQPFTKFSLSQVFNFPICKSDDGIFEPQEASQVQERLGVQHGPTSQQTNDLKKSVQDGPSFTNLFVCPSCFSITPINSLQPTFSSTFLPSLYIHHSQAVSYTDLSFRREPYQSVSRHRSTNTKQRRIFLSKGMAQIQAHLENQSVNMSLAFPKNTMEQPVKAEICNDSGSSKKNLKEDEVKRLRRLNALVGPTRLLIEVRMIVNEYGRT